MFFFESPDNDYDIQNEQCYRLIDFTFKSDHPLLIPVEI